MPEMHLRQSGFTYSACESFTEKQRKNKKILRNTRFKIYLEDLNRRTVTDKVLSDKAFNIAKSPKYDWYQRGFASMVYVLIKNLVEVLKMRIFQTNN